jgi:hypothetical protein
MIFGTNERGVKKTILFATALLLGMLACLGCGPLPQQEIIPAHYKVRPTDNGVYIFEYDAGNQGENSGDSLTLFIDAQNAWTRKYRELSIIRLERLATVVKFKNSNNQNCTITVVNVLVYTEPSGKPPLPADPPASEDKKDGGK